MTERVTENDRPYSINELAILHGLSRQSVIRLYEKEPGIEILPDLSLPPDGQREGGQKKKRRCTGRRHYRTIRVPRHVYLRVKHRVTQ